MLGKAWQQEGKALLHIACVVRKQRVEEKEWTGSNTFSCVPETPFLQHGSISYHSTTFLSSITSWGPSAQTQSL